MVFSSTIFLFGFLPLFLILYYIKPNNYTVLLFSLLFYSWGEPVYVLLMIFSTVINYICGRLIEKYHGKACSKAVLICTLIVNISMLGLFKYSDFLIENVNSLLGVSIGKLNLPLPIGISFYTFQTLSYIIDVYRGDVKAQRDIFAFATYVSLFPQLIAGPIVRYESIAEQLKNRKINVDKVSQGIERFIIGFAKKVIIANTMAQLADTILKNTEYSFLVTWLGAIAFMLQIYYDFSGYSDMAIGLGKLIGFEFDENFNYPYSSLSVTEFWRRWHISLSSWFRDYVYIPLGGNRRGKYRQIFNMFVVWALTGLWHGASWNFLLWGLYYFVLLVVEKYVLKNLIEKLPRIIRWFSTAFFVLFGWVIFYFDDLTLLKSTIASMFSFSVNSNDILKIEMYLASYAVYIIPAILLQFPVFKKLHGYIFGAERNVLQTVYYVGLLLVGVIAVCFLVKSTYNPFIYFRF